MAAWQPPAPHRGTPRRPRRICEQRGDERAWAFLAKQSSPPCAQSYPQHADSRPASRGAIPADRPGEFHDYRGGQKTANPAGHERDPARHFFQHFANRLINKPSTAAQGSTAEYRPPTRPALG
ncbi:putative aTP-binding component of ABC transporter [Pseudomonas paraeruginosa]|uniref:ATP-binding component of ABC transporter n=1 Tax=Pseudomonas paraeruginosa TaxID=2994495 RepID=A0A2R3IXJ3_9PSED|nr:putative aTP-binding component of ABC transporter [Pseudomonas paraeruginosa]AWE90535.1 putative aTP-binding component of ABC transporter [Pseudomonas paraeruginosa]